MTSRSGTMTAPDKAAFFETCEVISLHMRLVDVVNPDVLKGPAR